MRTLTKLALVGLGGSAAAFVIGKSQRLARSAEPTQPRVPDSLANDPADPIQSIDDINEFRDDELGVDAQTMADQEAAQDLATLEVEIDEVNEEETRDALDMAGPMNLDTIEAGQSDVGDLYGVHTPKAVDREHPDDDVAFNEGENWLESLQASAVENGADPELELDIVDDEDIYSAPHHTDTRDTPVADRGSGGPAGI